MAVFQRPFSACRGPCCTTTLAAWQLACAELPVCLRLLYWGPCQQSLRPRTACHPCSCHERTHTSASPEAAFAPLALPSNFPDAVAHLLLQPSVSAHHLEKHAAGPAAVAEQQSSFALALLLHNNGLKLVSAVISSIPTGCGDSWLACTLRPQSGWQCFSCLHKAVADPCAYHPTDDCRRALHDEHLANRLCHQLRHVGWAGWLLQDPQQQGTWLPWGDCLSVCPDIPLREGTNREDVAAWSWGCSR